MEKLLLVVLLLEVLAALLAIAEHGLALFARYTARKEQREKEKRELK
jgi:hypothetical protein